MQTKQKFDLRLFTQAVREIENGPDGLEAFRALIADMEQDHLAHGLVSAFCMGSTVAVENILELRAPFPINFKQDNHVRLLNDKPLVIKYSSPFVMCKSASDLTRLLNMAPAIGLGFLTGADANHSLLFDSAFLSEGVMPSKEFCFQGDLPRIEGDTIINPELVDAIREAGDNSAYPLAYDRVLCFVREDQVHTLGGDLKALEPVQEVQFRLTKIEKEGVFQKNVISRFVIESDSDEENTKKDAIVALLAELDARAPDYEGGSYSHNLDIQSIYSLTGNSRSGSDSTPLDILAIASQASPALQRGFGIPDGYLPCIVSMDRLGQLSKGPVEQSNRDAATSFMNDYDPLGAIAYSYDQDDGMDYAMVNWAIGKQSYQVGLINDLEIDERMRESLLARIPHACWERLFKYNRMNPEVYIAGQKQFGFDNKHSLYTFEAKDLLRMSKAGVSLDPDTMVVYTPYNSYTGEGNSVIYLKESNYSHQSSTEIAIESLMSMGVWPAEPVIKNGRRVAHKKPESTDKLIAVASRFKNIDDFSPTKYALKTLIKQTGVEECVRHASKEKHWDLLQRVFGDEIGPYMEKAPNAVKRKVVMQGLGL